MGKEEPLNCQRHLKPKENHGRLIYSLDPLDIGLNVMQRLEKYMVPPSEPTKLESSGTFIEYAGSSKLRNEKVLITGGEYAILFRQDVTIADNA